MCMAVATSNCGRTSIFFIQAEDGIRDLTVTGVQTCALPISTKSSAKLWAPLAVLAQPTADDLVALAVFLPPRALDRSEERRVGKEWSARWAPDHSKKKEGRWVRIEVKEV